LLLEAVVAELEILLEVIDAVVAVVLVDLELPLGYL
jgi:hypothetical protein